MILVRHLGVQNYTHTLSLQKQLFQQRINKEIMDTVLLVEHFPPVYTVGRRDTKNDILVSEEELKMKGIEVHHVGRGGNVTWHGPGQLVCYPILDLANYKKSIRWYISALQGVVQNV